MAFNQSAMKSTLLIAAIFFGLSASAQKREEFFNQSFKPATNGVYYYVVTEKKDSLWYRTAYYISQKTQAMQGWYKDEAGKIAQGDFAWFHTNRTQKSKGAFSDGKKEGVWLEWNEQGALIDSSTFNEGKHVGISMRWHDNGMAKDSLNFNDPGTGLQVSWYDEGHVSSIGRWVQEKKHGLWKYFHKNGKLMATEDYMAGKKGSCLCYDEAGVQLDSATCEEKAAVPSGGIPGWRRFLEQSLSRLVQEKAASRQWSAGQFTVLVKFVVKEDGSLAEFTPLTQYGKGVEEEVIRMLQRSPKWTPARQWGRVVKSYHTQPVTFSIQ